MADIPPLMLHAFWIVPLLLLLLYLHSPRFRGDIAESRVRRLLAAGLEKNRYTIFNNVSIPTGGGTTTIDHLVVSRPGIFVIDSVYARGWISGGEFQERWSQKRLWHSTGMENPVHRNRVQREAVQRLLGYPATVIHPLVVVVGHKGFRKRPPENVVSAESLMAWMRKKTRLELTAEQADEAIGKVDNARLRSPGRFAGGRWALVRGALWLVLLGGTAWALRDNAAHWQERVAGSPSAQGTMAHPQSDAGPKTEQEIWEDSLICAYSADTGRCACHEPDGTRATIAAARCQALAERGSVLRQ